MQSGPCRTTCQNQNQNRVSTYVVLQRDVGSGQAQVGLGDTGLDDHLSEELGVNLSVETGQRIGPDQPNQTGPELSS